MLLTIVLVLFGYFFTIGIIQAILKRYAKEKSYILVLATVTPVALLVLIFGTIGFLCDYLIDLGDSLTGKILGKPKNYS